MDQPEFFKQIEPDPPERLLKIEAVGDYCKKLIKPKIRLTGHWLERAGFKPGNHVHVTCVAPGLIELRTADPTEASDTKQVSLKQPECPF